MELIPLNFQIATAILLPSIIILEGGTTALHRLENIKEYSRNGALSHRQPWDSLPALMMAG